MKANQREKINELYAELRVAAQFSSMWSPVESWLQAQAIQRGTPIPKSNEPDSVRPGAPEGASYRWMEMCGTNARPNPPRWFYEELGIGTVNDYFGARQIKLRSKRLRQIAEAAKAQAQEEKREILKRTVKT